MEMVYDFTETNSTITVFIYKKNIKDMKLSPGLQNPKRLMVSEDIAIDLYRDVHPDIELQESKSRIEIHLKKIEHVKWGGINGKVPSSYGSREEKPIAEDDASEDANSAVDLFSKIYQKSGDDVRRAMEKSFYESEGTVLSTDWSQVKSKKVNREE